MNDQTGKVSSAGYVTFILKGKGTGHMTLHPRPQFQRDRWQSLDGPWDFAIDRDLAWSNPPEVVWNAEITVPFAPETPASGIHERSAFSACWYRRAFDDVRATNEEHLILHFGAVDFEATIWVNGQIACRHEGGYTSFSADITDLLRDSGPQEVVVRAFDDPRDLTQPRGKQDWQSEPHLIWYHRTTGIWQTVWLEPLPAARIDRIRWTPVREQWEICFEANIRVPPGSRAHHVRVELRVGEAVLAHDLYLVTSDELFRRIALSDPGIDDFRNELLWRPESPTLIDAEISLENDQGQVVDRIVSYTALRSVGIHGDSFQLNGRPVKLKMVLDQGYWPDSGLTAPSEDALRHDVELTLAMGFNGVRKHQKLEDPRYLYWADHLGLMVWAEMPSVYRFTRRSIGRLTREWSMAIDRDTSHPCIVAWVPFNESWGVPDLPTNSAQRDWVIALYHLTRTIDPTRPVIGNDGWESVATDIIGIHDYDADADRLGRRYSELEITTGLFKNDHLAGRAITIEGHPHIGQPVMLTEFGGIAFTPPQERAGTWGYARSEDQQSFIDDFVHLMKVVNDVAMFAGFCYTQFADTYQEANGLLYADRTPKIPLEFVRLAIEG